MSRAVILSALKTGPKTSAQLVQYTGTHSGDVSRTCWTLVKRGHVKRIDGGSGRGSLAVYALVDGVVSDCAPINRGRARLGLSLARGPEVPETRADRDPCFKCGVRGDLGCSHRRVA